MADEDAGEELCVALVPLFKGLTREQQLQVAEVARPTQMVKDQQVYAPMAETSQLMVVHTGRVKLSRVDSQGREQILRVLDAGDFMGETELLTGRRPDHFATALEPGSMCVFRHADLAGLVRKHPMIGLRMLQEVSARLVDTEARLAAVISGDVSSRLAGYLLSLPSRHGPDGIEVDLPLARKDIASLLDTTPESLSRQLRRLSDSGVISTPRGRRVVIQDADALMDLSGR